MGAIKIIEGSRVQVRGTETVGTVLTLTAEKSGGRGRPKTYASIVLGDGAESRYRIPELKLV